MSEYSLISPLEVYLPRKTKEDKKYYLNINVYRNTHHQILNQAKVIYNKVMKEQITKLPVFEYLEEVDYIIYKKSQREFDTPNVGAVISKFFMDALVINNKIKDDNYKITPRHVIDFGGISDKDYCQIILKGKTMNFSVDFSKEDIINALKTVYGKDVPENCIDNLKFEIEDGEVKAYTSLGSVNNIKSEPVQNKVEDTPQPVQLRRRNKSLSEEFSEVATNTVLPSSNNSSSDRSRNINSNPSEDSNTSNKENNLGEPDETEEVLELENPDKDEPMNESPSMESEIVKSNTFGSHKVRRRVL